MSFNFSDIRGVEVKKAAPSVSQIESLAQASGVGEAASRIPTGSNLIPDVLPQERVTGDILRGYGPRRGNLERLLRYWRPIMRREGGFRRCRVILADHPELYPLNNLCAWLHHETTGLWPNEGCHHPGMKNCRRKIRGVVRGSLISDSDFADRLRKLRGSNKKGADSGYMNEVVTEEDFKHAMGVMRDFIEMEPQFIGYLNDDDNWEHEGEDENGMWTPHEWMKPEGHGNNCGCG